jgi:predicted ATPase
MIQLKIRNFGPIKLGFKENDGWLLIKKNTFFIGNQGSGKSTIAKLISTLSWLEKAINRGDVDKDSISFAKFHEFTKFHKIHNYFSKGESKKTYIEYKGDKYYIKYDRSEKGPIITDVSEGSYIVPKIMYIPSERNFLSTINDAFGVTGLPGNLFTFAEELKKAQRALGRTKLELQLGNYKYEYDENEDVSYILGKGFRLNLLEASSGLQSYIPLYLVARNLSLSLSKKEESIRMLMSVTQAIRMDNEIEILRLNKKIPDIDKQKDIELIRAKYYSKCFINVVEEPEQNLFPTSQWEMLKNLLIFNNLSSGNKLIVTTHSPYIINYLTIAVKGHEMYMKYHSDDFYSKMDRIISKESVVDANELAIYECNDIDGSINLLGDYNGLPSDENYLNNRLGEVNDLFVKLLEIDEQCQ